MQYDSRIYVAGHRGLVGSAITRKLRQRGYRHLLLKTRDELDLTDAAAVEQFFRKENPEYVFLAAAKVGGIHANNTYPADFIRENLAIQLNVIDAAYRHRVKKLLFLGSSCIYPKLAPQPMKESDLLSGFLEPTNEAYAIAKIAGLKMCEAYNRQYGTNFLSVLPTNIYGIHDNFDLNNSHVLPALIRKFHDAKMNGSDSVEIWGTGTPRREFLLSDELADACVYLMEKYNADDLGGFINIGTGEDIAISELALLIKDIVGFQGKVVYNRTKPDGAPRKLLDVSKLHTLGWHSTISLKEGIRMTYDWFVEQIQQGSDIRL
jgi:GDP-L-fucose synthase